MASFSSEHKAPAELQPGLRFVHCWTSVRYLGHLFLVICLCIDLSERRLLAQ